jgi:DNA modification methylase
MENWPADAVERKPLSGLIPDARNARTHSDAQVAQIAASIREWGWTIPVLVDEAGTIIAGHGRVLAALKLGLDEVPVMTARGWSEAQRRAYVIADNKLAENADWDLDMLAVELRGLQADSFDLSLIGFGRDELAELLPLPDVVGLTDPDDAPPLPADPVSRLGDVWLCGGHRVACGDSTDPATVALALDGQRPHLMVTDPPYGVEYDANWRNMADRVNGKPFGARAVGKVENDERADWRAAWTLFPGTVAYIWHSGLHADDVLASLAAVRFKARAQIVWVKQRHVLSRGHYHFQHESAFYAVREDAVDDHWRFEPDHETVLYAVKDGATASWTGGRKQSSVWFIEHIRSETGHSTQKPVECMKRPLQNNSLPGDVAYDPFLGSGTSVIAAEMSGRRCVGVELSPAYVDVAVLRWQAFLGRDATLAVAGGRTFAQILEERRGQHARTQAQAHASAEA